MDVEQKCPCHLSFPAAKGPDTGRKIEERWLKDRAATGDGASIEDGSRVKCQLRYFWNSGGLSDSDCGQGAPSDTTEYSDSLCTGQASQQATVMFKRTAGELDVRTF